MAGPIGGLSPGLTCTGGIKPPLATIPLTLPCVSSSAIQKVTHKSREIPGTNENYDLTSTPDSPRDLTRSLRRHYFTIISLILSCYVFPLLSFSFAFIFSLPPSPCSRYIYIYICLISPTLFRVDAYPWTPCIYER